MFCRLTRWIDRITPIVFQIERRSGAKISLTDYLLRHPVNDASRVSVYNYTITVAKIRIISNSLGYAKLDNTAGLMKAKSKVSNVLAKKVQYSNLFAKVHRIRARNHVLRHQQINQRWQRFAYRNVTTAKPRK